MLLKRDNECLRACIRAIDLIRSAAVNGSFHIQVHYTIALTKDACKSDGSDAIWRAIAKNADPKRAMLIFGICLTLTAERAAWQVRLSQVAISHGSLTITVSSTPALAA